MLRSLVVLVCLAPAAAAGVTVVNGLGGPASVILQQALGNVQEGDIILCKNGDFSDGGGFYTLPAVSFSLISDPPQIGNNKLKPVHISGLAADKEILIQGFEIVAAIPFGSQVESCAGRVRFENCTLLGSEGHSIPFGPGQFFHLPGLPALHVQTSQDVVLTRCTLYGGDGQDGSDALSKHSTTGGPALQLDDARVMVSDSSLTGGHGGNELLPPLGPGAGGPAVWFEGATDSSHLLLFGSFTEGGQGGSAGAGGTGGAALEGSSAATKVWLRGSFLGGGAGGAGGVPGAPGPTLDLAATPKTLDAPWLSVKVPSPVRESEAASLTFWGPAGSNVFLLVGPQGAFYLVPKAQGAALVEPASAVLMFVGKLNGGGGLGLGFVMPLLPPTLQGLVISMQAAVGAPDPALGSLGELVWLDGAL